ncbi:MerR family transcriptional regulator [Paenibacillus sp. TRM 82003]|nr:MerR family transcriptional regulator [Paenibacillus sp. TRM 82003]
MAHYTIGEAASRAGVHLETVRYYERRGLLAEPPRTEAGYRKYDESAIERIRWIREAQGIGFTLQEIGHLLALREAEALPEEKLRRYAEGKLAEIDAKLVQLTEMKALLTRAISRANGTAASCPVLRAISEGGGG